MVVIDADVAITGVANIKYRVPVLAGQKLVAKAKVSRVRGDEYFVHVLIHVKDDVVFRGKFILVICNQTGRGATAMKLAIDAMGGDHAPEETVRGGVEAPEGDHL